MPNPADIAEYELPPGALIDALIVDAAFTERSGLVTQLRNQREKGRAALKKQSDHFNRLLEEVASADADAAHLVRVAEIVLRSEQAAAERLRPGIEAIRKELASEGHKLDPELRRYFQENLDVATGWLDLYKTLRSKLLRLSSDRQPGLKHILRARPVVGEIDHDALTREIVARFPKILAALAK